MHTVLYRSVQCIMDVQIKRHYRCSIALDPGQNKPPGLKQLFLGSVSGNNALDQMCKDINGF